MSGSAHGAPMLAASEAKRIADSRRRRSPPAIWRASTRDDLPLAALWALGAACALASAPILPLLSRLATPCPLRALTGIPCLTCGSTRAAMALARGDLAAALAFNPLAAIGLTLGLLGGALAPLWVMLRFPVPSAPRATAAARLAVAAVLASDWAYLVSRR